MTANGYDYDLVVIGSGPAGQKGAMGAAKLRKKVAVVDHRWAVGKSSVGSGTISSKTLREAVLSRLRQQIFSSRTDCKNDPIGMADLTARVETGGQK